MIDPDTAAPRATSRDWLGLALLVAPMLMLSTDLTVLFFAMPTIGADLAPSATESLWIVHVYGFLIAGFLITMGRLGDRLGPRRLLLTGAAAFAVLSAVAAFSVNPAMLITVRALLGVAGATLMPSLFALLRVMFTDDDQRRFAIAIMFSAFSVGGAVGPLIGGALLEFFRWGSVFLINVPPMIVLLALGPRLLPERRGADGEPVDVPSVVLSVTGMLAVVYGLQEIAVGTDTGTGLTTPALLATIGGAGVLAAFVRRQRRLRVPLLDVRLVTARRIAGPLVALLVVGVGVTGTFFLYTQHLQWVAGMSALTAGLWTLPYIAVNILGAMTAPAVAARRGPVPVMVTGLGIAAIGCGALALVDASTPLPILAGTLAVIALGQGAALALLSDAIIAGAPPERTASIAAAQEVGGELGTALGVAVAGAVGTVAYRAALALPSGTTDAERIAASIHQGMSMVDGTELVATVREAIAVGLPTYATAAAVLAATGGAVVAVTLRRNAPPTG